MLMRRESAHTDASFVSYVPDIAGRRDIEDFETAEISPL